jgi:hypothetical protein
MNALTIISTLMFCKATADKLETATLVLNELQDLKQSKKAPFFAIRRAIRMQEKLINDLKQ